MCNLRENKDCGLGFLGHCKLGDFIHYNNIFSDIQWYL